MGIDLKMLLEAEVLAMYTERQGTAKNMLQRFCRKRIELQSKFGR